MSWLYEQSIYDIDAGKFGNEVNTLLLTFKTLNEVDTKEYNEDKKQLEHERYVSAGGAPLKYVINGLFEKLDAVTLDNVQK